MKSSSGLSAVGALRAFGLLNVEGRGAKARYSLTERARRIIHEPDGSPRQQQALQEAAKSPEAYKILTEEYGMRLPPSDDAAISFLVVDHQFTKSAAQLLVGSYRSAVALAGLDSSLSENDNDDGEGERTAEIGDFVQWASEGIAQFDKPREVLGLSEDGEYAFVEGTKTGIPMSQLTVETPELSPPPPPNPFAARTKTVPVPVKMNGRHVQIIEIPRMDKDAFTFFESQLAAFKDVIITPDDPESE